MRVWFLFILYGIVTIAVKSVWQIAGDFLLIAVIFFGFYEEWPRGLGLSLILGFLLDVTSLSPLGTALFSYGFIFGLIRFFRKKILFQTTLSRFCWVALFSFIHAIVEYGFLGLIGDYGRSLSIFLPRMLVGSLLDGLLGTFWLPCLVWYRDLTWAKLVKPKDILLKK